MNLDKRKKLKESEDQLYQDMQLVLRVLRVIARGTTRYYEVLQAVLRDIMRYCEWYYKSLRSTIKNTKGFARH